MRLFSSLAFRLLMGLTIVAASAAMAPRHPGPAKFAKDFLWGAATAAQQVEGGNNNNDWHEWELAGKTKDPAGIADDFYHRYGEDFDIAKSLGHTAFRLSIEWSRIEPSEGVYSETEIEHYREVLQAAHERGLKTFVTLHHFTTPLWATHQGGWLNPKSVEWFGDFTAHVAEGMGDLVDFWLTLNEPNVRVLTGYVAGVEPPGETNVQDAVLALSYLLKGHARAYHVIHSFYPDAKVGFAHHMRVMQGEHWYNPIDDILASLLSNFWNQQILDAMTTGHLHLHIPFLFNHDEKWPELAHTLDFVGVNYYTRDLIAFDPKSPELFRLAVNPKGKYSDAGMEIYPQGFYSVLQIAGSYGLPVYITENGVADSSDSTRKQFICDHLQQMANAMEDGVDVRGYLHWAMMDNWEWTLGFAPRYGLVEIDYANNLARKVRPSALALREIIQSKSLGACNTQIDPNANTP